jgi:hypothetical protein
MHIQIADEQARLKAKWIFLLTLMVLAVGGGLLRMRAAAQPEQDLDWRAAPNALSAELAASDAPSGEATFEWTFDARGQDVSCSLDADGDGELDYRMVDCTGQSRVTHQFHTGESGVYFATLLARSEDGRTGLARARVEVR